MRRLTLTAAALLAAVTLSSCAGGDSAETAPEDRPTMPITPTEAKPAAEAAKWGAIVVEEKITRNTAKDPNNPSVGIDTDYVTKQLRKYDYLPEGAGVTVAWPESAPDPSADVLSVDYDLCVEMVDGTWATWNGAEGKVAATGLTGGCDA